MRRIWAFIVLVASIVLGVVFCGQPIADHMTYSSEFASGVELVYSLERQEGGRAINATSIGNNVMNRLDAADIKSPHVEVVGEGDSAELRVSFSPRSSEEINLVKKQVAANGDLTILVQDGDGLDYFLTGEEFFDSDTPMTLTYVGSSAYPGFKIRSKGVADSFAKHFPEAPADSNEEGESSTMVYIFQNFDANAGDSYETAFGENADPQVRAKVIASIAWEGNYIEDSLILYTTADQDGKAFTVNSAQSYVNAYNSADYSIDIKYLYQDTGLAPTLGQNALSLVVIALLVIFLLIIAVWIGLYGLSGVAGSLSLIFSGALILLLFSNLGFEFAPASIMAFLVSVILMVFNSVNAHEKIKSELKRGRSIAKATSEGFHKSIFVTIDTCLISFVVALFCFLLGNGSVKTFGGVLLIGSLVAFAVDYIIHRVLMYFMSTSILSKSGKGTLGLRVKKNRLEGEKFLSDKQGDSKNKIGGILGAGLVILSSVALLATGLTTGIFNNAEGYTDSGRLCLTVSSYEENYYKEEEEFLTYIQTELVKGGYTSEFAYDDYFFERNTLQDDDDIDYYQIHASFKISEADAGDLTLRQAVEHVNEELLKEDDESTMLLGVAKVVNIDHDIRILFLVFGLSILFASLYILVRYGLYAFLAFLVSDAVIGLTSVGLFSTLMLPFTPFVVYGFLGITAVLSFLIIAVLDRNRENIKTFGKKIVFAERTTCMEMAVSSSLPVILSGGIIGVSSAVLIIAITAGSALLSSYLIFTVGLILGIAYFLYFFPSFYLFLRSHIRIKQIDFNYIRKIFKRKKKPVQINTNEPHETIVPGLNEFR